MLDGPGIPCSRGIVETWKDGGVDKTVVTFTLGGTEISVDEL